jgi:hypothetical protein
MPLRLQNGFREEATFLISLPLLVRLTVDLPEKQALPGQKATKVIPEQLDLLVQLALLALQAPLALMALLVLPALRVPLVPRVLLVPPVLPVNLEVER